MTKLYLVRHCEAAGNVLGQFQGSIDSDITPNGAAQLKALADRFKDIKIDKFYSSPLKRAYLTAKSVADAKKKPITTVEDLAEIHGGILEGVTFDDIFKTYPEVELNWDHNPHIFKAPEGESMRDVYERAVKCMEKIISEEKGNTIFVASHGAVIRNLMCYYKSVDYQNLNSVGWSKNTGVNIIEFDDKGKAKVVCENDLSHIAGGICMANCFEKQNDNGGEQK